MKSTQEMAEFAAKLGAKLNECDEYLQQFEIEFC